MFVLGKRSLSNLEGVHPDLVAVVKRAITLSETDFGVIEGVRTLERQKQLLKAKATTTLNSRHITGHAVDLVPYEGGQYLWHWPLCHNVADAMKQAAKELEISIVWGGDWKSFPDGPHFELDRKIYK